jgi:DNA polymerase-4
MPPNTRHQHVIEAYLMHMSEKLAARLRRYTFHAQHFFIGVRSRNFGWLGAVGQTVQPTNDGREIYQLGLFLLAQHWQGEPVWQIQVTALDPSAGGIQLDLFNAPEEKREKVNDVLDDINDRFGEFAIAPAPLLLRSTMPNVIAPAWKPDGHRQTI